MSKRLELIASFVNNGVGVCDVGTDHAYLPVLLAKRGYCGNIIATDINEGPIQKAKAELLIEDLSDRVRLYMCDGLDAVSPKDIDTIIIAGMGGDTICGILDRAEWCADSVNTLILQPATKSEILRFWLVNNGFFITNEELLNENDTLYQIIIAKPGTDRRYLDSELYTGKYELIYQSPLFYELTKHLVSRFRSASAALSDAKRGGLSDWKRMIDCMTREILEMREKKHENG